MSAADFTKIFLELYSSSSESMSSDAPATVSKAAVKQLRNGSKRRRPTCKKDAPWQRMLDECVKGENSIADANSRDGKYFRRRFRMPYDLFCAFIKVILHEAWFPKFDTSGNGPLDCTKNRGASLQVMVLSVLRVLGRGVVFDDCFDGSGCGEESIRVFFHAFTAKCCQSLFQSVVKPPRTLTEIFEATRVYQMLGVGAAVGSTDCTHIELGNCPNNFRISCSGKSGKPTLSYSLTCSHQRKIFHVTSGFAGSKNDKHISRLDSFITAVGSDNIYKNFEWTLDNTETTTKQEKGVFLICDGGYHKWPHMICGLKVIFVVLLIAHHRILQNTSDPWTTLWSLQMESVRKDVECTFGILKCRFRILRNPVPFVSDPHLIILTPQVCSHVV